MQLGSRAAAPARYVIGGVELDDSSKEVTLDGEPISLTPIEYDILKLLMESPGKVYSPKEIYRQVWKEAPLGSDNTVAVHIRHLREKIEIRQHIRNVTRRIADGEQKRDASQTSRAIVPLPRQIAVIIPIRRNVIKMFFTVRIPPSEQRTICPAL